MKESTHTVSDAILCFIATTEVAITSQFLWTEVLIGRVEELKSGVIRSTATLFMMIWATKEDEKKKLFTLGLKLMIIFKEQRIRWRLQIVSFTRLGFTVFLHLKSISSVLYAKPQWLWFGLWVLTKWGWPTLNIVPERIPWSVFYLQWDEDTFKNIWKAGTSTLLRWLIC